MLNYGSFIKTSAHLLSFLKVNFKPTNNFTNTNSFILYEISVVIKYYHPHFFNSESYATEGFK